MGRKLKDYHGSWGGDWGNTNVDVRLVYKILKLLANRFCDPEQNASLSAVCIISTILVLRHCEWPQSPKSTLSFFWRLHQEAKPLPSSKNFA